MNRYRIFVFAAAALSAALWAYACGDGTTEPPTPPPDPPRPTTVTVSPATAELPALGATVQLSTEVRDQNGQTMAGAAVTWASNAAAVATVSASGLVTAAGNGEATVTASAGSASGSAVVTVAQAPDSVAVSPAAATMTARGDTLRLVAQAFDANVHSVAAAEFSWASGDPSVATVDGSGLVTAAGNGTATITAAAGSASGTATVTVAQEVSTVAVTPVEDTLVAVGDTVRLTAVATDANGHPVGDTEFSWSSSDMLVAVVDGSGLVTAAGNGTTTITAMAGEAHGFAEITVENPGPRAGFTAALVYAPEGDGVILQIVMDEPPESTIAVRYTTGIDDDPGTADADTSDYADDSGGSVQIAAGATGASIAIAIHDDDSAEPAREVFTVTLDMPGRGAGYVLGPVFSTLVMIEEGVCDRTPQVRDEVLAAAGLDSCSHPDNGDLARIRRLDLCFRKQDWMSCERSSPAVTSLRQGDFLGMAGLEELNLQGNELTELPPSVFADLSSLRMLDLGFNGIGGLPARVFRGLGSLQKLSLQWNSIGELPEGAFADLRRLRSLELFANELRELPPGIFLRSRGSAGPWSAEQCHP